MEGEEGEGLRLSKRFADKAIVVGGGEVDYKTKAGTAWSHSYLNQKPWHPLSYPNQRRKWIAEQVHAERERRADDVAREVSPLSLPPTPSLRSLFASWLSRFVLCVILIDWPAGRLAGRFLCSMLRSRSSFARLLSSPRKRRRRYGFGSLRFVLCNGFQLPLLSCYRWCRLSQYYAAPVFRLVLLHRLLQPSILWLVNCNAMSPLVSRSDMGQFR